MSKLVIGRTAGDFYIDFKKSNSEAVDSGVFIFAAD